MLIPITLLSEQHYRIKGYEKKNLEHISIFIASFTDFQHTLY